jgi:hypothetical protein
MANVYSKRDLSKCQKRPIKVSTHDEWMCAPACACVCLCADHAILGYDERETRVCVRVCVRACMYMRLCVCVLVRKATSRPQTSSGAHAGGAGSSNLTRISHDLGARLGAVAACRRAAAAKEGGHH